MDAISIARGGLQASMARLDASASRIAAAGVNAAPEAPGAASAPIPAPATSLADDLVEQLSAKLAFEANVSVIRTASDLERRTIERWG